MRNRILIFLEKCDAVSCLLLLLLFFWVGQRVKDHLIVFDERVIVVLREAPYLSFSFALWIANAVAGTFLLCALFLVVPFLRRCWLQFTIFIALLLLVSLPLQAHINTGRFNYDALVLFSYSLIISGIGVALCFRGVVNLRRSYLHVQLTRIYLWVNGFRPRTFLLGLFVGSFLVCSFISWQVFDGTPGSIDSCVYMFQARLFAEGSLYAPSPPEPEFFDAPNVILTKKKWYTQYPPGHPLLLALGVIVKMPWVINPLFGSLTVVCIYLLGTELYGLGLAKISGLLSVGSGFFLFMSSEFMSHCTTLFFITLTFLSLAWMLKGKRPLLSAAVCGVSLGIAVLCRPYTTCLVGIPLGIAAIVARKNLSFRQVFIGAIPFLMGCLAFLVYNLATNGHPFLFGYIALHGKGHYPGFHLDPEGEQFHTVSQGFKYMLGNLNGLNWYLFEWPISSLFFVCLFLGFGKKRFWEWLLIGWIGALLIGHFFYYFNQLAFGPRFVYEAFPAFILLTSRGLVLGKRFLASWRRMSFANARNVLFLMLVGLFLFAFLFNIPAKAKIYQSSYGGDITIQKYLEKSGVANALVFVRGARAYLAHYPFNAPFAAPHIYANDRGSENRKLADKFPDYRYFIADENEVREVSLEFEK